MYEAGNIWARYLPARKRQLPNRAKDEEVPDRPAEVAFAIAEHGLQAGGERVSLIVFLARRSRFRDRRHVAVDRGVVASNGQPPS